MNKDRYLIGDVANLMGMSRDTLRHYEKRGLVTAKKAENGYRYYTEADISRLIGILYQRKMDIGLDDIATLWDEHGSEDSPERFHSIISQRLEEEKEAILQHKRTIAKLRMSQKDCENLRNYTGKVIQCPLPDSYIIDPDLDFHDGLEQWFQYTREHAGLENMYLFDEYRICRDTEKHGCSLNYQKSQLLLHCDMAEYTDYPLTKDIPCTDSSVRYLSAFCTSQDRIPDMDVVNSMLAYARKHSLPTQPKLLSTFLMQGMRNQIQCYYLQLFLPLSKS